MPGIVAILHGGRVGEDIVLHGSDVDGHNRWTFTDTAVGGVGARGVLSSGEVMVMARSFDWT